MRPKSELGKALHDDPVGKIKAAEAAKWANSPRQKLMQKHADEVRALGQKIREEGLELEGKHRRARNAANELSRPKPFRFEENLEKERKEQIAKHDRERAALRQRHERELSKLGG